MRTAPLSGKRATTHLQHLGHHAMHIVSLAEAEELLHLIQAEVTHANSSDLNTENGARGEGMKDNNDKKGLSSAVSVV